MNLYQAADCNPGSVVEGAAFSKPAKLFAGAMMGYLLYFALHVAMNISLADLPLPACAFVLFALACLLYAYYWILASRTTIDGERIRQSWAWDKSVRIADITKVKFICVPYLEWLIAPRIVVQVNGRGSYTFYAADRELLVAFARLSLGA